MQVKEKLLEKLGKIQGTVYNETNVDSAVEVMVDFINVITIRLKEGEMTFKEIVEHHHYLKEFCDSLAIADELVKGLNAMQHAMKEVQYQGKGVE